MSHLADTFLASVADCLGLPTDALTHFRGNMDRLKFVKYPPSSPESQGVGPHKDSTGLFTFLWQDSVGGLQVLNKAGEWIDATPMPGGLVVNIAQGFEAITGGRCPATAHRVVVSVAQLKSFKPTTILMKYTPKAPTKTVRYSIPYFLAVRYDLTLEQLEQSAADICARIPVSSVTTTNINHVASEFLSPAFSCVS